MAGPGKSSCSRAGRQSASYSCPALDWPRSIAGLAKRCWAFVILFGSLFVLTGNSHAQATLLLNDAPAWMHYFCDSSEADPNGSLASIQGAHCFPSFTVPAGTTLTISNLLSVAGTPRDSPRGALLAMVDGPCTILGTIDASASNTGYGDGGGSGGGGGGASTATSGQRGFLSMVFGSASYVTVAAGGVGGTAATAGTAGASPTSASQKWIWNTGYAFGVAGGSAGGPGGVGSGGAAIAGNGGGGVELICESIDFTGTIKVNGSAGANGTQGGGGAGGGGGGVVMMAARSYTSNTGTIIANGGSGGTGDTGAGAGGAGGPGWSKQFTLQ